MTARTLLFDAAGEPLVQTLDPAHALLAEVWGLFYLTLSDEDLPLRTMTPESVMKAIDSVVGSDVLQKRWHAEIQRARAQAQQEAEGE